MGGYFLGRPMEPESGPAKTRRPIAGLHILNMGWTRNKPAAVASPRTNLESKS